MVAKKKALVICQPTAGRLSLGIILSRLWYEPVLTKTVFEAMRLIEDEPVSVIMLDGDAPDPELLGKSVSSLKSAAAVRQIPLVVVLTSAHDSVSARLLSEGCAAVITKPVDVSLMYGILGRLTGEARKTPRAPVRMRVTIEERSPAPSLFSINISEGGIYLRTADPLPEDMVLHLSFTLPHDQEKISISGKVVRNTPLGVKLEEEPGMGINFVDISDDVRTRIRNFVTWALSSDLEWELDV